MPDEIKVYADIFADTTAVPTDQQWRDLAQATKDKPLASAIMAAARASQNEIHMHKRCQGVGVVNRHALLVFEIDRQYRDALLAVLDAQAAARNVTGTARDKFEGVLTAELREGAVDLGFSQTQANRVSVTLVSIGVRGAAEDTVHAYLAANAAVWYGAQA